MTLSWVDTLIIFLALMGPTKAFILFGGLTEGMDSAARRKVAIKAVVTASAITFLFLWAGKPIIDAIHVSIPALKIAGGIILGMFAVDLVLGGAHKEEGPSGTDVAIFPLALPLMATPQGIVILITFATAFEAEGRSPMLLYILLGATMLVNLIFLLLADRILKYLSPSVLVVLMKLAGVLLTALAVQLVMWGLFDLKVISVLH